MILRLATSPTYMFWLVIGWCEYDLLSVSSVCLVLCESRQFFPQCQAQESQDQSMAALEKYLTGKLWEKENHLNYRIKSFFNELSVGVININWRPTWDFLKSCWCSPFISCRCTQLVNWSPVTFTPQTKSKEITYESNKNSSRFFQYFARSHLLFTLHAKSCKPSSLSPRPG